MTADERPRPHAAAERAEAAANPPAPGRRARLAGRRPSHTRVATDAACAVVLAVLAMAWFGLSLDRTLHTTDEGYLLRMGQRVAAGEVPHRDFVEDYGPGVFVALGALVSGGDGEILFVRRAIAVWKTLAVLLGFAFARLLLPLPFALGVALASIVYWGRASLNVNAPHAAVFTIPICMAAALVLALAIRRGQRSHGAADAPLEAPGGASGVPTLLAFAGALCALAVLFKQSLGVMNAVGLSLALYAAVVTGLDAPRAEREPVTGRVRLAWLAAWLVAAALILVPGARYLTPFAYLVHFAPVHVLMAFVSVSLWRSDRVPGFAAFVRRRALPFAVGLLLPLLCVATFYLSSGHLDDLVLGMFDRPLRRRNYATPLLAPPASITAFVLGVGAMLAGATSWLTARARATRLGLIGAGAALATVAVLLVPHSNPELYSSKLLSLSAVNFDWVLHSSILLAAAFAFGPALIRVSRGAPADDGERRRLAAVLPLFFFSAMLCFQIFPRGAHNVWMAHPAWMPLLGVVLHEPWRRLAPQLNTRRRVGLALVLAVAPLWLAWPVASRTWQRSDAPARTLALPKTFGMQIQRSSISRYHLADVERLVARLEERPRGPLLLVGGDVLIHYLTDRPPLRPEHEYALYNVVLGMLPLRELAALEDGDWVARLRAEPNASVVVVRDDAGRRVREALPTLARHLDDAYVVEAEFGPYVLMRPVAASGAGRTP